MGSRFLLLLSNTIMYATPYAYGALGGMISEKSGVTNIGLEGMMTFGAAMGVLVTSHTGNAWLGFLAGGIAGVILATLHAVASIHFQADQSVSGTAINLIGPGISLFLCRDYFDTINTPPVPEKLPKLMRIDVTAIIVLLLTLIMWYLISKTKYGMRITAAGHRPEVCESLGINVYKIRYFCVILSGFLAGLGGAAMTLSVLSNFNPTAISGHGFIALTCVIIGRWNPIGVYLASLLFGFVQAFVIQARSTIALPSQIMAMLPYLITIIVLIVFSKKSSGPRASGVPFERNS